MSADSAALRQRDQRVASRSYGGYEGFLRIR